jgi:hypothetical protein
MLEKERQNTLATIKNNKTEISNAINGYLNRQLAILNGASTLADTSSSDLDTDGEDVLSQKKGVKRYLEFNPQDHTEKYHVWYKDDEVIKKQRVGNTNQEPVAFGAGAKRKANALVIRRSSIATNNESEREQSSYVANVKGMPGVFADKDSDTK